MGYYFSFAGQPPFSFLQDTILLAPNQCNFIIADFDENPSTGYVWDVAFDDAIFNEPHKEFVLTQTKSGMVGVGGKVAFSFSVKQNKCHDSNLSLSKLTFTLKRAWENSPIKTKNIEVRFNSKN